MGGLQGKKMYLIPRLLARCMTETRATALPATNVWGPPIHEHAHAVLRYSDDPCRP